MQDWATLMPNGGLGLCSRSVWGSGTKLTYDVSREVTSWKPALSAEMMYKNVKKLARNRQGVLDSIDLQSKKILDELMYLNDEDYLDGKNNIKKTDHEYCIVPSILLSKGNHLQ